MPHQLRHTYATEMLRAGVGFPALMKLLGHVNPEMTMRYLDVALTDLQREFQLARSKPRHLAPQPKTPSRPASRRLDGVIDSLLGCSACARNVPPHPAETAPREPASTGSLIGLPKSSLKRTNSRPAKTGQRLAG